MTRAHEMGTIHTTTNQSLQAELRDRTEQYNQLWVGCQRQFAEMERLHFNALQQLQLELVEVRERNGAKKEESSASRSITKDAPQFGHDNGHHDATRNDSSNEKPVEHSNGHEEHATSFVAVGNASQAEHNSGVPFTPSLLGLSPYLPPAQMAVHPFMIPQQGVLNPASPHVPQNHPGHFQSVQTNSPVQYWQNQQYEMPVDGQTLPQYVDAHASQGAVNGAVVQSAAEESQDQKSIGNAYLVEPQFQHSLQDISSQFQDTLNLNHHEDRKIQEGNVSDSNDHGLELRTIPKTNNGVTALISESDTPVQLANSKEIVADSNTSGAVPPVSATQTNSSSAGKTSDSLLLDERLLLACIARTMPASGKIRISSTLPNRLAKMLAPLHWHDYKKIYGKLDDFVAGHPELFVIEGDFIQLREGALKKIAATAAAVKVAAAAATPPSFSSVLPSMAVTPVAQSYRLKKSPSSEVDQNPNYLANEAQHSNGIHFSVPGGQSGMKTMSSSADRLDLNGSENRFSQPNVPMSAVNGAHVIGSMNARMPANFAGRQHGRAPGATSNSQR
uniref:DUF7725 domain-containing protein n=1 Tax=Kalanchoe fedtschenkoi TaxID=63787 RepID=A0A7N0U733_KALFE